MSALRLERRSIVPARRYGRVASAALVALLAASCRPDVPASEPAESRTCSASGQQLRGAFMRVDSILADWMEAEAIPGLAAGVICGGEYAWARGYGMMALDDPRPVTPDTRFRIASITKLFTATAVLILREEGALALEDSVRRHLPWFVMGRQAEVGRDPVTIHHLLTHTGGLPRDSRLTDFARQFQPDRAAAIEALPSQELATAPGEAAAYSNLGYGILGEVIAAAADTEYAAFLEHRILGPLGMTATLVHPEPDDDQAWGHGPVGPNGRRSRAGFWRLSFATPAGGMAASVEDLGRFVLLHLSPYLGTAPAILSGASLRDMHRVHHEIDPQRGGYGLGWGVETSHGQHVIYHGGELPDQTSFLLIDLRSHVGVIVLTNAQDVDASGMAQEILRLIRSTMDPEGSFPAQAIPPA